MNKYAVVTPIKSKNGDDVLEWAKEALRAMGAKPTIIYRRKFRSQTSDSMER